MKIAKFKIENLAKRVFGCVLFAALLLFVSTANAQDIPADESQTFPYTKKFVISSYYTPLPGQTKYFTGSFEGDVRLNGEGVTAADGTKVYPGMAAAPKRFPFGTKMQIPGVGMVAIHDRGGAIKNNRLDIWMGRGEEGLRRALGWGMRSVDVTVYGIRDDLTEAVSFDGVPLMDLRELIVPTRHFKNNLAEGDEGQAVLELQRVLKKLGYFTAEETGYFGQETRVAVENFQSAEKVITGHEDPGAGNFGPRSRVALEAALEALQRDSLVKVPDGTLQRGSSGKNVRSLQELLKDYGFLKVATGTFGAETFDSLVRFQIDRGLVATASDRGAGFYGPRTKQAFEEAIRTRFAPETVSLVVPKSGGETATPLFSKALALGDRGSDVERLQQELRKLNFLSLPETGYYGKITEHAVFKFQQAHGILKSKSESGAGVVGPQTMSKLAEIAGNRHEQKRAITKTTEQKEILKSRVSNERVLLANANINGDVIPGLAFGSRGAEVENLQKMLKRLGFFPGRLTTQYFGEVTQQALRSFQKSHGLAESGSIDEETQKILNSIVSA